MCGRGMVRSVHGSGTPSPVQAWAFPVTLWLFLQDISDVTESLKADKQLSTDTDIVFVKQMLFLAGNMNFPCSFPLQIFKVQGTTHVPLCVLSAACPLCVLVHSAMMPSLLVKAAKYTLGLFPPFSLSSVTMFGLRNLP